MNAPKQQRDLGFSLMELMIGMTITVLAGAMIFNASSLFQRGGYEISNVADFELSVRQNLLHLGMDTRMAESITIHDSRNVDIRRTDGVTVEYEFKVEEGRLDRRAAGETKVLMNDLDSLAFSHPGGDNTALQVTLEMSQRSGMDTETKRDLTVRFVQRLQQ